MPSGVAAMTPARMKPACAIDEYASSRLMSVCVIATIAPPSIVTIAMAHITGRQSQLRPGRTTYSRRSSAPNAATLVAAAMKPVTGVGAPW